ncbi:DUF4333 domain-containing protein [Amycolatopsis rhizosphaerae]|uniref:DUF4333 domain-containing protein n=1 Tax=Amycolatopsis rhizosphaerae TaxID=2053003 RepID=A0A558C5T2_9PSEU|nr:DUF4333 domain-containing protein [Amycolatopsis rhizosphaerae]TVT44144.1 DUF4333 domain-containing protein [Amycolatopsis rhizosphaerae]
MSTPYGGNEPPQWGQAPQPPGPQSGGFPAAGQPQQPPPSPQYGQEYGQQYGQQPPGFGRPPQQQPYPQQYGQYPQQQFAGQQPGPFGQPAPARKGGKVLWIVIGALVVVVAALGITGFVTPGFFVSHVLDATAVQNGVKDMLSQYGTPADSVSCPPDQPVKAGTTFTCTASIGGQQQKVLVTVKDEDGLYQVGMAGQ